MSETNSNIPNRLKEFAFVSITSLVLVLLLLWRTHLLTPEHPAFVQPADHHKYIHMAEHGPTSFHIAPFCRRVLVPLIASRLPSNVATGFLFISIACTWATGMMTYYLARAFLFERSLSIIGMFLFFSLGYATRAPLMDFWLPDAARLLCIVLAIYACRMGRWLMFAIVLAIGVAVKESVIIAAPLYLTLAPKYIPISRRVMQCMGGFIAALAVLIGLWTAIPAYNNDAEYVQSLPAKLSSVDGATTEIHLIDRIREIGMRRILHPTFSDLHAYTVGSFGVLLLVMPLLNWRQSMEWLARFSPFIILVYAQLLIATDTQRLLIMAFPAFIITALYSIQYLVEKIRVKKGFLVYLSLLLIALNLVDTERIQARTAWQIMLIVGILCFSLVINVREKSERIRKL